MTNLPNLTKLLEQTTPAPYFSDENHSGVSEDLAPVVIRSEYTETGGVGWNVAVVLGDVPEINPKANAQCLTIARNNFTAMLDALTDCARLLANEGHSYSYEVNELLAKIEKEAGEK